MVRVYVCGSLDVPVCLTVISCVMFMKYVSLSSIYTFEIFEIRKQKQRKNKRNLVKFTQARANNYLINLYFQNAYYLYNMRIIFTC